MAQSPPPDCLQLSIVDQTMCRHYIRNVLCFPFPDPAFADAATRQLNAGLRATLQTWPYLAGRIRLVSGEGPNGHVQVRYSNSIPDPLPSDVFEVRKHHDLHGSASIHYNHMTGAGMPCSFLPTRFICSLPDSPDLSLEAASWPPVLHVAVNFIPGGLLLAVYVAHSVVDGVGLSHLIDVFAEHVRLYTQAKAPTPTWFDRTLITADAHKAFRTRGISPCPEFKFKSAVAPPAVPTRPISPPNIVGRIFRFSAITLHHLRQRLSAHLTTNLHPNYLPRSISTWDTLAALLWVYQIRARFGSRRDSYHFSATSTKSSRFGFTINVRRRLDPPLPDSYIGNAVLYTYTELDLDTLLSTNHVSSNIEVNNDKSNNTTTTGVSRIASLHPTIAEIPIYALASAALHIRAANSDFDTDAIYARLAYLTQVPVPQTGSLVPNMVIAQDDPDYRSSVTGATNILFSKLYPGYSSPPGDHLHHQFQQQQTFKENPTPWEMSLTPPPDVFATSWEDIGANADFSIIGTDPTDGRPQYVRKPKSVFNEGGTIILPRRKSAKGAGMDLDGDEEHAPYEVLLQMPEEHMERLCWSSELGGWAERIVE